jgi:hypothetical protein
MIANKETYGDEPDLIIASGGVDERRTSIEQCDSLNQIEPVLGRIRRAFPFVPFERVHSQ